MPAFRAVLKNTVALRLAMLSLIFLFIPAFSYGVACLWGIAFLFVFVHLGRVLCQASLRLYEERLSYTNEAPKMKGIVAELCAYLSLPFVAYMFIMGDINAVVSSGLDRAVILSLPLEAIKLPIDGDPSIFQMLLVFQLLLSVFGFGAEMLYARKEILAMSLPDMPVNKPWSDDASREEKIKHNNLWGTYYFNAGVCGLLFLFLYVFVSALFGLAWTSGEVYIVGYVFVLLSIFVVPYFIFSFFFAIAYNCISCFRMS